MYWTLELASKLEDAPWPASKDELIDYAIRSGAPMEVIENLQDPGNVGTIIRSANAFDIDAVIMVGACADLQRGRVLIQKTLK